MRLAGVRVSPILHIQSGPPLPSSPPLWRTSLFLAASFVPPLPSELFRTHEWSDTLMAQAIFFQDEDRRMAGVQARKEEEKKRESHKQTIHKVPV